MEFLGLFGFICIFLGVVSDQITTIYGLKRMERLHGTEKALEKEKNPFAREDFKKGGITWGNAFIKEIIGGLFIGVLLYSQTGDAGPFIVAMVFFGVAMNNIIKTFIELKNYWFELLIVTLILLILAFCIAHGLILLGFPYAYSSYALLTVLPLSLSYRYFGDNLMVLKNKYLPPQ